MQPLRSTESIIKELVRSTGAIDAPTAIRLKARELLELHVTSFGPPSLPINLDVLASLRGIIKSDELPVHSPDAELVPDGTGRVAMRVHPDRPETRQRFSVAHEISHTFFPDYTTKAWCRTDSRFRDRTDPDEYLEMLCDIAAAELLFPQPWFSQDATSITDAAGLVRLATTYHASREATMRRFAETSAESIAAVFLTWKLKPTQKATIGQKDQANLFGVSPQQQVRDALRLRIDYAAMSETFKTGGHFLPKDKSVENEGPIYLAASTGNPSEDECYLDLGPAAGRYRVWAIPLWTAEDQLGSNRENTVAAILKPTNVRKTGRQKIRGGGAFLLGENSPDSK
jgi:hypothetical protein